jgi:glutamate racemase
MVAPIKRERRKYLQEMIGVFDSGYGGLTILQGIHCALPEYSTIYFGDNSRAPYGERSDEEIIEFTRQGVELLFQQGCIVVVLGCNTASAAALRKLQQEWLPHAYPDRRILGILVPTVEVISTLPHEKIGVLATAHTVATNAYEREIHKLNSNIEVIQYACNNLAGMIEVFGAEDERVQQDAEKCVYGLLSVAMPNAILLGCTHYEFIAEYISSLIPKETTVIRQPELVAESLMHYLARHPEIDARMTKEGKKIYLTSGNVGEVSTKSSNLMHEKIEFQEV